jgi:hypothetical protein
MRIGEIWKVAPDQTFGGWAWKVQMPKGIATVRTKALAQEVSASVTDPNYRFDPRIV